MMGSNEEEVVKLVKESQARGVSRGDTISLLRMLHEVPQHRVRITRPFYLGVYPVTQSQWESVEESNPSAFSSNGRNSDRVSRLSTDDFPVEKVSWEDAQRFIGKLNERSGESGWVYRLPTEAEREYACRAGTTTRYHFGDDARVLGGYAWYRENSGRRPRPVGRKRPNAWGLYDMHGNVWEWCLDWYGSYANSPLEDPTGPESGRLRVLRGADWDDMAERCRSAYRNEHWPGYRSDRLGFRVAFSLVDEQSLEAKGLLALAVDEPDALVELLDGTARIVSRYRTTGERLSIPLEAGEYLVSVEKSGFAPFETSLTVTADGDYSLEVALVPMESQEDVPLLPWDLPLGAPAPALAPFDSNQARAHQEAWAEYLGQPVEITQSIGADVELTMAIIPPGEFMIGSPEWEVMKRDNEGPRHLVRITRAFYLGVYPVTQSQWVSVMGNTPSPFSNGSRLMKEFSDSGYDYDYDYDRPLGDSKARSLRTRSTRRYRHESPVNEISWEDAQRFIGRLNERSGESGWVYRLPTEAEWEYACRAGTMTRFFFGDDEAELREYAWYRENSDLRTHPVGQKRPNAWGLYDLHGNVWEWCSDWFSADYYANSPLEDPTGPESGSFRVLRGGSWGRTAEDCRSALRYRLPTGYLHSHRYSPLGFRVAFSSVE